MAISGVLITGGGGFLGSHLAEHFLKQSLPVICVDNFCTGLKSNYSYLKNLNLSFGAENNLELIEADATACWSLFLNKLKPEQLDRISHVFHFASPASPVHYQELSKETMWVNSVGLNNAIEFADSVGARVVFASTSEVYGDPNINPQPETYWGNVNPQGHRSCYDEAKRFGEALIFSHNERHKTHHGIVRIFNTFGPRMNPNDGRVIINFLVQAMTGQEMTVLGDGTQTRSFCYVSDLIRGIVKYAESEVAEPINIGSDKEFSILELAQTIQKLFKQKQIKINRFELPSDDPKKRRPDLTKAKALLGGWEPKVSLQSGLEKMVEWLEGVDLNNIKLPGRPK